MVVLNLANFKYNSLPFYYYQDMMIVCLLNNYCGWIYNNIDVCINNQFLMDEDYNYYLNKKLIKSNFFSRDKWRIIFGV